MSRLAYLFSIFALAACSNIADERAVPEAFSIGTIESIYVATNRNLTSDGTLGAGRTTSLRFLDLQVSLPPGRKPGVIKTNPDNPNPKKNFVVAQRIMFPDQKAFESNLHSAVRNRPADGREVTVFVHGYNNSLSEAAFRAAQLKHDLEIPGEVIAFSWPSRGTAFGYAYDKDSVLSGRDMLAQLLIDLLRSGIQRIVLVGHSMGAFLSMESLREIDLKHPGWSADSISGVVLISPDIDIDVFRSQASQVNPLPQPFIVFTSTDDPALRIAARFSGRPARLGNLSQIGELSDFPVTFIDVTAFSKDSKTAHFVAGSSPALISILDNQENYDRDLLRGESGMSGLLPGVTSTQNSATQTIVGSER
ncbi:MAG: alpha/beta fold hydrolase [Paracoccaceae bacterium]